VSTCQVENRSVFPDYPDNPVWVTPCGKPAAKKVRHIEFGWEAAVCDEHAKVEEDNGWVVVSSL